MTAAAKKDSEKSHDPLADLDDDLGDDWESAFQAEDFMFSPEDESTDFFLLEEDDGTGSEDIAELFEDQEGQKKADGATADIASSDGEEAASVLEFPGRVQIFLASLLQLFQSRSLTQRFVIGALPVVVVLIIVSGLFFRSTTDELASLDVQVIAPKADSSATLPAEESTSASSSQQESPVGMQPPPVPEVETVQEKWKLPSFIIVAKADNKNSLVINIDLTLIAKLEIGQELPEDKATFVKDVIYQFYANRPAYELKRFALARGEMINQLNAWLNKQWQDNPIDTITFSHYQVTQTSPALAPKVTFM